MGKMTQKDKIRKRLLNGKSITAVQAMLLYRCFRLPAVIWKLRHKEGLPVVREQRTLLRRVCTKYRIDKQWLESWKRIRGKKGYI